MSGNPVSRPLHVEGTNMEWVDFKGAMMENLAVGSYSLRPKARVTEEVPGVDQCSPEDQLLFSQIDAMEISILDNAIVAKIRQVNSGGNGDLLLGEIPGANGMDVPHVKTLLVSRTPWKTDAKKLELVKDLGGMMEMRYDKILVAVAK